MSSAGRKKSPFIEIYAAIAVLLPLLSPLAKAYGIEPVYFGVLFPATMKVGFLCAPCDINLYFAASIFKRPSYGIARFVTPAALAIFAAPC